MVSDEELKSSRLFYCAGTSGKRGVILSTSKYPYTGFFHVGCVRQVKCCNVFRNFEKTLNYKSHPTGKEKRFFF